jgi:teichuronic acid biosynthesis glycosyltransferase TuaG
LISDDASTNVHTREILNYYKDLDKRIKVFLLPQNLGPACARNKSITEARGKYIAFCDSDDYWAPDYLDALVKKAVQEHADCVVSNYIAVDENRENVGAPTFPVEETDISVTLFLLHPTPIKNCA